MFPLVAALRALLHLKVGAAMEEQPDEEPSRSEVSAVTVEEKAFRPAGHQLGRDQLRPAGHQLGHNQLRPAVEEEAKETVRLEAGATVEEDPDEAMRRPSGWR